ncbi:MAG: VOC family protein [Flavobacteriales bacterium]
MSDHALNWFELPALDLDRAYTFYHTILGGHVRMGTFNDAPLVLFDVPFKTGQPVGGALVRRNDLKPTTDGPIIYLNCSGKLALVVSRVVRAGGQVIIPELNLGAFGFSAIIMDSEGNKVGLISNEA